LGLLVGWGFLKEATRLSKFRRLFLLGTIALFLLAGAAWGQSRTPTSPGLNKQLPSDREDVKPPLESRHELPLKDLREKPLGAPADQPGKSLKKGSPVKPKSTVSRGKKPGAEKPASGADQDRFALTTKSDWWPTKPPPTPPTFSSPELNLGQSPEKDSSLEEDDAEDKPEEKAEGKGEKFENLPQELKRLLKSQVSPQDTELDED
jgi:hypothetical protein